MCIRDRHLTWHDYLESGPITAIDKVREICKVDQVNTLGWCVGGTLLTSALAVLAARSEDKVASLTLLTTLLEYSETGELGLFIDEASVAEREAKMAQGGLLMGLSLIHILFCAARSHATWPGD